MSSTEFNVGDVVRFKRGWGPQGITGLYVPGTSNVLRRQTRGTVLEVFGDGTVHLQLKTRDQAIYTNVPVDRLEPYVDDFDE